MTTLVVPQIHDTKTLFFKPVQVSDAEFILSLRTDEKYNKFLSPVTKLLYDQEDWIMTHKDMDEYYFIIHRKSDGKAIGTVRIYNFIGDSFEWGSWILTDDKPRYAALECAIAVYDFGFSKLGYTRCHMHIMKDHKHVLTFHRRMGVLIDGEENGMFLGYYDAKDYFTDRQRLLDIASAE